MYADLHLHTFYSDGTLSPRQVAQDAVQNGIGILSVTDHNTRAAYPAITEACREFGLRLIPGVEIDCTHGGLELHILSYGASQDAPALNALLDDLLEVYEQKSVDMLARLSQTDSRIRLEEYAAFQRNPANGGWKGLDYLRTKGYEICFPQCMEWYRGISWRHPLPDLETVCAAIHAAGGVAVAAHPGDRLPKAPDALDAVLESLLAAGIDGVECYYPSHTVQTTQLCLAFCRRHGLLITAGSDSHGAFARQVHGVCYDMGTLLIDERDLNLGRLLD